MNLATQHANDLTIGHHGFIFTGPLVLGSTPFSFKLW